MIFFVKDNRHVATYFTMRSFHMLQLQFWNQAPMYGSCDEIIDRQIHLRHVSKSFDKIIYLQHLQSGLLYIMIQYLLVRYKMKRMGHTLSVIKLKVLSDALKYGTNRV